MCDEYEILEEFNGVELHRTPTCFAVHFQIDTTGDGVADDNEVETFDHEGPARQFMADLLSGNL